MTRTHFDLTDPAAVADPDAHDAWLRDEAPVYHCTRPDVALAVQDANRFSCMADM